MKRLIFGFLAVSAMLCGCQKNDVREHVQDCEVFQATIEDVASTRTVMDADNNILWSAGDQIVVFKMVSLGMKYQITEESVGKTSARFVKNSNDGSDDFYAGTEWDHNVAYYPYSDAVEAEKSGSDYTLNVTLPSDQTYAPDSFGNGAMAMVAVSEDNNFTFRNVLGGMKLQLKGTQAVTSIVLEGKNSEKLSGAATVTAYTDETKPAITMSDGASTSVTLDCGSGVQLNESTATEFIIALPPVTFSQGFTVTVTDSDGKTYTVETDKLNEVIRSSLLVMPPVTLDAPEEEEPEISGSDYVDEYGINHGQGVKLGETVWAPVNCGYHATDFKYGKLYQWGRKYGQGYGGSLYDESGRPIGTYSDATTPAIEEGGVSVIAGNDKSNENIFYTEYNYDWVDSQNHKLWNSGTESDPIKTEYDPCPSGWRVPTVGEIRDLCRNFSSWTSKDDQPGYWLSGSISYAEDVPKIFFPAAGDRYNDGRADSRGTMGYYWSSSRYNGSGYSYAAIDLLFFEGGYVSTGGGSSHANGYSVRCVQDNKDLIPVSSLTLDETSLLLNEGETAILSATISPSDANHQSAYWYSEDPSIAAVDQNGKVTAVAPGTTNVVAVAGMQTAICEVTVNGPATIEPQEGDYVDEYGINHGPGVKIGETVWAPVNCGYHATDYAYGKLYQWGRKYGQGYSGYLYDIDGNKTGEYSDATTPTIEGGGVSVDNSADNVFYKGNPEYHYDWVDLHDDQLWNSGTESEPLKTEYDPCPTGWRIPTSTELSELYKNHSSWTSEEGQPGYWFSGASIYTDNVSQVFFPAAGRRNEYGEAYDRGDHGHYWSSSPSGVYVPYLYFHSNGAYQDYVFRALGYSVRCVQE